MEQWDTQEYTYSPESLHISVPPERVENPVIGESTSAPHHSVI